MLGRRRVTSAVAVVAAAAALLVATGGESVVAAPRSVHFTAVGDYSTTPNAANVLSGIGASGAELNLALGDMSYGATGQEQTFCDFVTSRVGAGFPFELISGNHESNGLNGNINDFSACLPNQLPGVVGTYGRQWYADYPKDAPTVRFVMISPGLTFPDGLYSYAAGSPRYNWTADAIDGARSAGIPWVVVGMHKPCITVGEYACDADGAAVMKLLMQKKVDLVLDGHEHLYQRTKQLALSAGCPALATDAYDADCVVDGDDTLVKGAGTVVTTVGTGGIQLRDVHTDDPELGYFAQLQGNNTAASYGFLDVVADATSLTARFIPRTGAFSDTFTITQGADPPPNAPPTATIGAPQCSGLGCTLDGTGSTDGDGTIVTYAWTFGDGATAATPTASHTWASGGTYPVTLTVTDDDGATSTATTTVTVSPVATPPVALDSFSRTVSSGFGKAEVGGSWTAGSAGQPSVGGGVGKLLMPNPGTGPFAYLGSATALNADLTTTVSLDKNGTGSGTTVWVRARHVASGPEYRLRLRWLNGNVLSANLAKSESTETVLGSTVQLAGGVTAGERLKLRLQVTGTSPTTLRAKIWRAADPEPAAWTVSATDSTAALQAAGWFGVITYLSTSSTNAPVTLSLDDWQVAVP